MAVPTLTPKQTTSAIALPETGTLSSAGTAANYPLGLYVRTAKQDGATNELRDVMFVTGAYEQVNYTYRKLGGDVLDVELTQKNIFAAYEEAVVEYSYIVNIHQAKNTLGSALGNTTGSFDQRGQLSGSEVNNDLALRYPRFDFGYARQVADAVGTEVDTGGTQRIYSASISASVGQQDYDLQTLLSSSATTSSFDFYNKLANNRVFIRKVFYKTPHSMWRFYGYYGGLNAVGNLSTYGMYSDDSTFEIIPVWQNKQQAMAYEDAIWTRNSHYSYELKDNRLRIFPIPTTGYPDKIWVEFTVRQDVWDIDDKYMSGSAMGVNNLNTMPFGPLQFNKINSIGKQWIRKFALALTKEMLGQVRGKFGTIPIPGNSVNLNASDLLTQAREEKEALRTELKETLEELTYKNLAVQNAELLEATQKSFQTVPYFVYVG